MAAKVFAVEFVGVLADGAETDHRIPFQGSDWRISVAAREAFHELQRYGRTMIHTRLISSEHNDYDPETSAREIQRWLHSRSVNWDYIWTGTGKPVCDAYVETRDQLGALLQSLREEEQKEIERMPA